MGAPLLKVGDLPSWISRMVGAAWCVRPIERRCQHEQLQRVVAPRRPPGVASTKQIRDRTRPKIGHRRTKGSECDRTGTDRGGRGPQPDRSRSGVSAVRNGSSAMRANVGRCRRGATVFAAVRGSSWEIRSRAGSTECRQVTGAHLSPQPATGDVQRRGVGGVPTRSRSRAQ